MYLALHNATGELRAVKVGALDDPTSFRREIAAVDGISHPHLVKYFEYGVRVGQFWIAMEYLGNYSLDRVLGSPGGRPDLERSLLLGEQVRRGLAALHERGVMHRDVKPANVMVDDSFRLRLIDFGLAKSIHGDGRKTTGITRAGDLRGTPIYMSPEQVHGESNLTKASDMWSFGVMFYELLTGTPPFQGANEMALGAQILHRPIELEKVELPASVRPFLSRCLERELSLRVSDASVGLKEFAPLSLELRRQLRHERYRSAWIQVFKKGMLEGFAAEHGGKLPDGAVPRFRVYCSTRGVPNLDDERLEAVLPPVFAKQRMVEQVRQAAVKAKEALLKPENARFSTAELSIKLKQIETLEQSEKEATAQVSATVRQLLDEEVKAWDQIPPRSIIARRSMRPRFSGGEEAKRLANVKSIERKHVDISTVIIAIILVSPLIIFAILIIRGYQLAN